ncbi:PspC domain-containing protein [Lapidilactobacillus luobeiensis]|uniref:PspC domain-containing protein n=1 Tax=Lapidilactobacillus luobeiensis TaxID=2950371 RepID=UPI0035A258E6
MRKKLYRSRHDVKIAGVCSGLADYFNIDVTLVRVIFAVLALGWGSTIALYIILWIVVPEEPRHSEPNHRSSHSESDNGQWSDF